MAGLNSPLDCVRCARILHTGEARVLVAFTVTELAELAQATLDLLTRDRLVRAIALLDPDYADMLW